jgi:hypothetical protein
MSERKKERKKKKAIWWCNKDYLYAGIKIRVIIFRSLLKSSSERCLLSVFAFVCVFMYAERARGRMMVKIYDAWKWNVNKDFSSFSLSLSKRKSFLHTHASFVSFNCCRLSILPVYVFNFPLSLSLRLNLQLASLLNNCKLEVSIVTFTFSYFYFPHRRCPFFSSPEKLFQFIFA